MDLSSLLSGYPKPLNPHLDQTRQGIRQWAWQTGLLCEGSRRRLPAGAAWDEEIFDAADLALQAAYSYPHASAERLFMVTKSNVWIVAVDDYFSRTFKLTEDQVGARVFVHQLKACLQAGTPPASSTGHPIEHSMIDIFQGMSEMMSAEWKTRWRTALIRFAEAWLWELAKIRQQKVPTPLEFTQIRRDAYAGQEGILCTVEYALGVEAPRRLADRWTFRALVEACTDTCSLFNDLVSHHRESREEGELCNAVTVFADLLNLGERQAQALVAQMVEQRLHDFEAIFHRELPALLPPDNTPPTEFDQLNAVAAGLRQTMIGLLMWQKEASRYASDR
ncbi:hypothetical protein ACIBF1_21705 [Spirillospora sp. NPDC050679]